MGNLSWDEVKDNIKNDFGELKDDVKKDTDNAAAKSPAGCIFKGLGYAIVGSVGCVFFGGALGTLFLLGGIIGLVSNISKYKQLTKHDDNKK